MRPHGTCLLTLVFLLNKWLAKIPVGEKTIECVGVCFLQFDSQGKIRRNEVYFDRTELVSEIYKLKKTTKQKS